MSGFKPRIGSDEYIDRLNSWFTMKYYDWFVPEEDIPQHGSLLYHWQEDDPWIRLYLAVVAQAVADYFNAIVVNNMKEAEHIETYFLKDEDRTLLLKNIWRMVDKKASLKHIADRAQSFAHPIVR